MKRNYTKRLLLIILAAVYLLGGCSFVSDNEANTRAGRENSETGREDGSTTGDAALEVHFIDIGQGDSTFITCDGHAMLIDGGNNGKGTAVQLYLEKQGIESLDYVIGTHPDSDHIGGLDVIIYKFDVGKVIMPDYEKDTKTYQEVIDVLDEKNYKITLPAVGDTYSLGQARFTIIAPGKQYKNNANDNSVGILLEHGSKRFVLTGDAEEESEEDILKSGIDINADVYKVSHHGSKTASTDAFLEAVNPAYGVISCGEGNTYGHPHAEVMNKLREAGIKVFRTDEQGTIVAKSDGREITWNCSPSESWKAGEPGGSVKSEGKQKSRESKEKESGGNESRGKKITYIVNENTKKFHLPDCGSVEEIQDKNKIESSETKEKLIEKGYSPCKRCLEE